MAGSITKNCPHCGVEFKTRRSVNQTHCSKACSFAAVKARTYEKYKTTCELCGVEFLPPRPKEGGRFCSYRCRGIADRKERIDRNGYWYVFTESHPKRTQQGYVGEHVLVMEAHIGRFLADGEVVHHIDHNRKNNKIENLSLMTDSEHKSLHMKEAQEAGKVGGFAQRQRASRRMMKNNPGSRCRGEDGKFVSERGPHGGQA